MSRINEIQTLEKRVNESRLYNMNFSPKMADAESITNIDLFTSAATTTGPTALTLGSPAISGKQVQVRISAGTDGGKYLLTCRITTDQGNKLQAEGYLFVKEPG